MAGKIETYKVLTKENPFGTADVIYKDIIEDARREKQRWQLLGLFSIVFLIASFFVMSRAVSLQKTVPVLVTLSEWGEATYKGKVDIEKNRMNAVPDAAVQYQVRKFITDIRTIPLDGEILYRDITQCYDMVTSECAKKLTGELRKENIFGKVGKEKRSVEIETVLKLSGSSYQIDWRETATTTQSMTYRMRGVVTIELLEPPENKIINNPLGIYIADYDMTILKNN
jgi:type IV secretion system protein VirB5